LWTEVLKSERGKVSEVNSNVKNKAVASAYVLRPLAALAMISQSKLKASEIT
jgi:hypothetical protein